MKRRNRRGTRKKTTSARITPATRRKLIREARALGMDVDSYLAFVLSTSESLRGSLQNQDGVDMKAMAQWAQSPLWPILLQWVAQAASSMMNSSDDDSTNRPNDTHQNNAGSVNGGGNQTGIPPRVGNQGGTGAPVQQVPTPYPWPQQPPGQRVQHPGAAHVPPGAAHRPQQAAPSPQQPGQAPVPQQPRTDARPNQPQGGPRASEVVQIDPFTGALIRLRSF